MPKAKAKPQSKTDTAVSLLQDHPSFTVKELIAEAAKHGVVLSPHDVSNARVKLKGGGKAKPALKYAKPKAANGRRKPQPQAFPTPKVWTISAGDEPSALAVENELLRKENEKLKAVIALLL